MNTADERNAVTAQIDALAAKIDGSFGGLHDQVADVKRGLGRVTDELTAQGKRLHSLEVEHGHTRKIAEAARDNADHLRGELLGHMSRMENRLGEVQRVNEEQNAKLDKVVVATTPSRSDVFLKCAIVIGAVALMALGFQMGAPQTLVLGVPGALGALAWVVLGSRPKDLKS